MTKPAVKLWIIAALLLIAAESYAQPCPQQIRGGWESELAAATLFDMSLAILASDDDEYIARLGTAIGDEDLVVRGDGQNLLLQSIRLPLAFDGRLSGDGKNIDGFIAYAANLYRVSLAADNANSWSVSWSPLPVESDTVSLDLYFDDDGAGGTAGYFFFRDERLPGLYGFGTRCDGHKVHVGEKNLGLIFDGEFDADFSQLDMTVTGPGAATEMVFSAMSTERLQLSPGSSELAPRAHGEAEYPDRAPERTADGWPTAKPSRAQADIDVLRSMVRSVADGELPLTHSILVARSGDLIVEEYFYGYDRDTMHDMRSASKTIASTLVGLAVDRDMIEGSRSQVLPFFPEYRSYENWHPAKANIRIRDLLTMSSGLDANDAERDSVAAEGAYQSQSRQPDWIKLALDAPMIAEPGRRLIYGSANPLILGGILDNVVGERVEWFAENNLFGPLRIEKYRIYMDPTGVPYMGGWRASSTQGHVEVWTDVPRWRPLAGSSGFIGIVG